MTAVAPRPEWTLEAYIEHNEALRLAEERFQAERDRRYSEVKSAEAMALRIKEEADKTALGLQRDNQQYRDEKGNELRAQIERERGTYITRAEFKPVADYVTGQQGGPRALTSPSLIAVVAAVGVIASIWIGTRVQASSPSAPVVTVTVPAATP